MEQLFSNLNDSELNNAGQGQGQGLFIIRKELDSAENEDSFVEKTQFMGFLINNREVLIEISLVNEIIMLTPITYVPNAPLYIEGVINLRGNIIPVINLRKVFDLPKGQTTNACRVIISKHKNESVGLIVDAITYVISVAKSDIEPQSISLKSTSSEVLSHFCKIKERILGVIDVEKIISQINPETSEPQEEAV